MKRFIGSILIVLLFSGCATQTFLVNPGGAQSFDPALADVDERQTFFLDGVGQEDTLDAAAVCGGANNVAAVQVQQDALDVLFSFLTSSIWTPRQARVYCL